MVRRNEVCGGADNKVKYYGSKQQCLEAPVKTMIMTTDDFSFANRDLLDVIANWKTGVQNKDLYPFPNIEGIEDASTEATTKEGRYTTYLLKKGVEGAKYRFDVSICTFSALKTLDNSDFKRVFEITEAGEVTCEVQEDGTIKGRKLSSFFLENRKRATDEDVPFVNTNLKFENDEYDIVIPKANVVDLEGIYDTVLSQISAISTSIKFKLELACSGNLLDGLQNSDFIVKDATGAVQTVSFVPSINGVYEITGSGFATGFTVELNGTVTQSQIIYEGANILTVTV